MRSWAILLGGLLVWAAHFFLVYGFASAFPGESAANWLTIAATLAALAADALLIAAAARRLSSAEAFDRWVLRLGMLGAALSLVSVLWQGLPAIAI